VSVCFSPDGTLLASGSYDTTVKLWNVRRRRELSAQQLWDAIGKKDIVIEEQKTLIGKKDERIEDLEMQHELDCSHRAFTIRIDNIRTINVQFFPKT
jgi:WD40 repeat protein